MSDTTPESISIRLAANKIPCSAMDIGNYARAYAIQSNEDHRQIIESIEQHNEDAACQAITQHIGHSYERFKLLLPAEPRD